MERLVRYGFMISLTIHLGFKGEKVVYGFLVLMSQYMFEGGLEGCFLESSHDSVC